MDGDGVGFSEGGMVGVVSMVVGLCCCCCWSGRCGVGSVGVGSLSVEVRME